MIARRLPLFMTETVRESVDGVLRPHNSDLLRAWRIAHNRERDVPTARLVRQPVAEVA